MNDIFETLRSRVEELPSNTTFVTPLSRKEFRITEIGDSNFTIEYRNNDESDYLQCEKLKLLFSRIMNDPEGFDYDRLPPNAEPYATILSLHPHIDLDDKEGEITSTEASPESPLISNKKESSDSTESTNKSKQGKAVSLGEMLSNMGTPQDNIECPITGCEYTNRSAKSVAAHVSRSSTAKHIWSNTSYSGWRDFVRKNS